jgi:Family of unknown function (DUF5670)
MSGIPLDDAETVWTLPLTTIAYKGDFKMLLGLFFILVIMWLLGFFAFHIAGGLIHLLLIIAVISLVMHLFRGRSAA